MAITMKPRLPLSSLAPTPGAAGEVAKRAAGTAASLSTGASTFEAARSSSGQANALLDLTGLPQGGLTARGLDLVREHPALDGAIAQLAQQLTPELVTALGEEPRALTAALERAVVTGEVALAPPGPASPAVTTEAPERLNSGATSWPVLGNLGGGDLEALSLVVLMEAAKAAQEDLKSVMAGVKAINQAKAKLHELLSDARELSDRSEGQSSDSEVQLTPAEAASLGRGVTVNGGDAAGFEVLPEKYPVPRGGLIVKADLDATADALQQELDSLSELGETESLRLQQAMDHLSKLLSTLATLLKKNSDTEDGLTKNLK